MAETENQIEKWYVLGCLSARREEKVRDALRKAGFRAHVPMKYSVKKVRQKEYRVMTPAITGLIFARGAKDDLQEFINHQCRESVYIRKSTFSNKKDYLTVGDAVMEKFIELTNIRQEQITYFRPDELKLNPGDVISIKGGIYDGYEGTVLRQKGKKKKLVVVQIPGVLIAAVEIAPDLIELKQEPEIREKPSKDVDADKKYLLETAEWLMDFQHDKDVPKMEYNLKLFELKRTRARLLSFKGFTPATEAELALPLYLAACILDEDKEACEERLRKATERLKDTSKLKEKCQKALKDNGQQIIDN